MNRILTYLILLGTALLCCVALPACVDELDYPGGPIEPGISTVDVSVGFRQFSPELDSRAEGNAIKAINTLWVVIYDKDRNFVEKKQILDFTINDTRPNTRPDGQPSTESSTGHAEFKLTLPNGYYYIYAVANMAGFGNLTDDDIATPEKLRSLDLQWDYNDVTKNSEMFGWFVNGDKTTDHGTEAPQVTVSGSNTSLHAWLRRAASKVTIAFNTTKLSEHVRIYLKSVTIKDIPEHCYLDAENKPGSQDYTLSSAIKDGETIYFGDAKADQTGSAHHRLWQRIHSGDSIYGIFSDREGAAPEGMTVRERLTREHSEAAPALYFYENMQGVAVEEWQDKRQDITGENKQVSFPDGVNDTDKAWKDGKPFGSYIEIQGYYENEGTVSPGRGDIIYRFMLGKNHINDFNAERNCHYQLTMNFNGNANDIDFHIDYKEEAKPGFYVQDTTYVSYLYNQESATTIRATPRPGYELLSIKAYILDNEWRPYPADGDYNTQAWDWQTNFTNNYKEKAKNYTRPTAQYNPSWTDFSGSRHSYTGAKNTEFGFLSLRKVTRQVYELGGGGSDKAAFVDKARKLYFLGNENASNSSTDMNHSRGYRDYGTMPAANGTVQGGTETDGYFSITRKLSNNTSDPAQQTYDYIIRVPFYTRAKSIDSWAVYSGANPYYRHHRYARVLFIARYKKVAGSTVTTPSDPEYYEDGGFTHVLQARRLDNPRAIYRRRENAQSFHVRLCYNKKTAREQLEDSKAQNEGTYTFPDSEEIFEPIKSRGPWMAFIERDPHGLVKISTGTKTVTSTRDTIYGRNDTPIDFTYTPNAIPPEGDAYGAIITVRYHNYSCTHKIIVRQGYDAHDINGGPKWSLFNVFTTDSLTKSPLSIGSTYRRNSSWGNLIKESNNKRKGFGVEMYPPLNKKYRIHGNSNGLGWYAIPHDSVDATSDFFGKRQMTAFNGQTYTYRLPTSRELESIGIYFDKNNVTQTDPHVEDKGNAFGICYADGATETDLTKKAYGFYDPNNSKTNSKNGVRGVVVYSLATGDNIFFPFGCFANPRRRDKGFLQYGSVGFLLTGGNNNYRPMAHTLMYQSGAAYWLQTDDNSHVAIDFNGGNYMASYLNAVDVFQEGGTASVAGAADALPIKLIRVD